MHSVILKNSHLAFFKISGVRGTNVEGKQLQISDLQILNLYATNNFDIISFENLETDFDFGITMSDIEVSNITFANSGGLFHFGQQTRSPLVLRNGYFYGLYGAIIYIESSNLSNLNLFTNVKMINVTAESISSNTKSFIINNEGGYLEINNSTFRNMNNFGSGTVITGGYQNSQTLIYNSTFTNNTSIYGGVAYVHSGSVIKFFN